MQLEPYVPRLVDIGRLRVDFDTGRIFSEASNTLDKPLGALTKKGYLRVCVTVSGKQAHALAHRVVWCAANGPVPSGKQIDHINGLKTDNRLVNLQIVDQPENMRRAVAAGLMRPNKHDRHYAARLSAFDVAAMRKAAADGEQITKIASRYGVSASHARRVINGKRWSSSKQERPNG